MFCCIPVGPEPALPLRCLRPAAEGSIACDDHRRCSPPSAVDLGVGERLVAFATEGDVPRLQGASDEDRVYGLTRTAELLAAVRRGEGGVPPGAIPGFAKELARGRRDVPHVVAEYVFQMFGEQSAPPVERVAEWVLRHPLARVSLALVAYADAPCFCIDRAFARDLDRDFDGVLAGRLPAVREPPLCWECVEGAGDGTETLDPRDAVQWIRERFPISPSFIREV